MFSYFRSTRFKMAAAKWLYLMTRLAGLKRRRVIVRQGIRYEVDLAEGVDLSLFCFGRFQGHVFDRRRLRLPEDAVIFDVGANVGAICLPMAAAHPRATIYAFEPTDYALAKLRRNLDLNPQLGERILPVQTFLSSSDATDSAMTAFASWNLDDPRAKRHPVHRGIAQAATKCQTTIDSFVAARRINRLDFLKIDTDGYELDILQGAAGSIARFRPAIVFEASTYLFKERGITFARYEDLLRPLGYRLEDSESGKPVCSANVDRLIPPHGSIDILALPAEVSSAAA